MLLFKNKYILPPGSAIFSITSRAITADTDVPLLFLGGTLLLLITDYSDLSYSGDRFQALTAELIAKAPGEALITLRGKAKVSQAANASIEMPASALSCSPW
ncbi:hypothetical protein MRX96_026598 [Rhipicephalus microplus]